jgi:dTDP-4-amino-4,6-dideoxygalactose transaminase
MARDGEAADRGRTPVPILRPLLPPAERLLPYLRQIDATRVYSNHGTLLQQFQQRLSDHLGLPAGGFVAAASGTAALIGAILAVAGRATADRPFAVMPAYTFVATALAVEQCGYRPYLADIEAETWMLDPQSLAGHPLLGNFGLVVPVAPFGRAVPLRQWQEFQRHTGVPVVIDGAACFENLEDHPDRHLGEIPVALSLHATKSFATGEGGAVATTDVDLAERVWQALNFGFYSARDSLGPSINGKMSEYHAAVGLAELDGWPAKRDALTLIAQRYGTLLDQVGLRGRFFGAPDVASCYPLFCCEDAAEAEQVRSSLSRHLVDYRLWYGGGVHRQTYFAQAARDELPRTEAISPCVLGLPTAPDLPSTAMDRVVEALAAAAEAAPFADRAAAG